MPHPLVVHNQREHYDVLVDRSTEWGNPFRLGEDGSRDEVINKYRRWLWAKIRAEQKPFIEKLAELEGKTLGCWCAPESCHAEVLVAAAVWAKHVVKGY